MRKAIFRLYKKFKKAKYVGKYLFSCKTCSDKSKTWIAPLEYFIDAKQISMLKKKHENHSWVIRSESVLSVSKLKELQRWKKK